MPKAISSRAITLVGLLVVGLWFGSYWLITALHGKNSGIVGDTFGAVNALFSGLAFVGLFYAILLQKQELKIAKEDASTTRKILDDQTRALNQKELDDRRNALERTFFELASIFQSIKNSITAPRLANGPAPTPGSASIELVRDFVNKQLATHLIDQERIDIIVSQIHNNSGFRFLELCHLAVLMMELFDGEDVGPRDVYMNTLRTFIGHELGIFFLVYATSNRHGDGIRRSIERFGLLASFANEYVHDFFREKLNTTAFEYVSDLN